MAVTTMNTIHKLKVPLVPWKAGDVLAASLAVVIVTVASITVLALVTDDIDSESALAINVSVAAVSAILLLASWLFGPLKHSVPVATLGLRSLCSLGASQWLLPLMALAIVLVFNGIYGVVMSELGWGVLEPPDPPFDADFGATSLVIAGILIIGVGPFAEEVFFRGFVLAGLARRWGPVTGLLASSLLFSLAHGSVALLIPIFVAGSMLAWLYLRTGSLRASVLAHSAQNAVAFAVTVGT